MRDLLDATLRTFLGMMVMLLWCGGVIFLPALTVGVIWSESWWAGLLAGIWVIFSLSLTFAFTAPDGPWWKLLEWMEER